MEDLNVVDYAQLAHMNRVRSSGGSRDETLLRYRAPVPRGPTWDGVVVDDRIVVEEVPKRGCAWSTIAPLQTTAPWAQRPVGAVALRMLRE